MDEGSLRKAGVGAVTSKKDSIKSQGAYIFDLNSVPCSADNHSVLVPSDINNREPIYLWLSFSYRSNNKQKPKTARCEFTSFLVFGSDGTIINSYYSIRFKGIWQKISEHYVSEIVPAKIQAVLSQCDFESVHEPIAENMRFTHVCYGGDSTIAWLISNLCADGSGFGFDLNDNVGSLYASTDVNKHRIYDLRKPLPPEIDSFCPFPQPLTETAKKRTRPPDGKRNLPASKISKSVSMSSPHQTLLPTKCCDSDPQAETPPNTPIHSNLLDKKSLINWLNSNSNCPRNLSRIRKKDAKKLITQLLSLDPSVDDSYSNLDYKMKLSLLVGQRCRYGKKTFRLSQPYINQEVWEILSDINTSC